MATSSAVTCCVPTTPIDRPVEPLASALASITVTTTPRSTKWSALDKPSAPPPMTTICNAPTPSTAPCETDHFFSRHRNPSDGTIQHSTTDVLQRIEGSKLTFPMIRSFSCYRANPVGDPPTQLRSPESRHAALDQRWLIATHRSHCHGRAWPCHPRLPRLRRPKRRGWPGQARP